MNIIDYSMKMEVFIPIRLYQLFTLLLLVGPLQQPGYVGTRWNIILLYGIVLIVPYLGPLYPVGVTYL
jgi:hypothetical protein